jgi:hypothetical protein
MMQLVQRGLNWFENYSHKEFVIDTRQSVCSKCSAL